MRAASSSEEGRGGEVCDHVGMGEGETEGDGGDMEGRGGDLQRRKAGSHSAAAQNLSRIAGYGETDALTTAPSERRTCEESRGEKASPSSLPLSALNPHT